MIAVVMHVCKHVVGPPARRVRKKNEGDQRSAIQLAADFTFVVWLLVWFLPPRTRSFISFELCANSMQS